MKVAVVNYSGNVGKTTVARHLLAPRMGACPILYVETINEGAGAEGRVRGRDFKEVLKELPAHEHVVVDVGSSNVEEVFAQLERISGSHEDFDCFVVPTVPAAKQQADTAKIVEALFEIGVEPSRIRLVFNQVERDEDVARVFAPLINAVEPLEVTPTLDAVIHRNELFAMLGHHAVRDAMCAGRDFNAEIAAATGNPERQKEIAEARIISRLAKGVNAQLDRVFSAMFPTA